ncbi:putative Ig domain-containing protein [Nonomuraea polychroma]|uniref:Putative Ig domain-containing protein n=1 Tax=Nonomuraea polychroma TaxID=46176 RepID=A0A438MI93_9ACTN|nr:putative Ig domain-containing protein [Nonomuraea polychroma]RVX45612.1 putative Ig domain-containing protein [Nonomuraea polychroma]
MNPLSRRSFLSAAGLAAVAGSGLLSASATPAWALSPEGTNAEEAFAFAHPGLLHSRADLDRMKSAVAAGREPIAAGFAAMAAHARSQHAYTVQNTGQITTWGRGPTNFANQAAADAAAAYQNALMWAITGDVRHADKARDILDAWAASLTGITGADGQLGAGIQGFKLVNAAEILRHTGYDGWPEASVRRCVRSFTDVWYPAVSSYCLYANGNWDLGALRTILAIAVFCDDRVMFEDAMRFATAGAGNGSVLNRVVTAAGQGQESGRDQAHEQLAVGLLADAAEVAWQQGVDLFGFADDRMLANFEYFARYNLGDDSVPFTPDLDRTGKYIKTAVSNRQRAVFRPLWEMGYAHYAGRLGKPAPYTEKVIFRGEGGTRVVEGYNDDHPSWGTLTFAGTERGAGLPAGAPTAPAGVTAASGDAGIEVAWAPAVGAQSYAVWRKEPDADAYTRLADDLTATSYTDRTAGAGRAYAYTVTAANGQGAGPRSLPAVAASGLPAPWRTGDIGATRPKGRTGYDGERVTMEAGGTGIAENADSFRFAWLPLAADGTVTARVVYPLSSQYSQVGVMVRGSLEAGAPHAAMLLQGLPLHTWSGVWTVRATPGGATRGTGSIPVPPSQRSAITVNAGFPISELGPLPESATPLESPYVEAAGDGYRLRMPYWVRITRKGSLLTGEISPDGHEWTTVGSDELPLGRHALVGLAFTSCLGVAQDYAETGTACFDNVTIEAAGGTGWSVSEPQGGVSEAEAAEDDSAVQLTWRDDDLSGRYTVWRGDAERGPYEVLATGVAPVGFGTRTRFRDATGVPGRTYHYVVARGNTAGTGPRSRPVSARMPQPSTAPALSTPKIAYGAAGRPFRLVVRATGDPVRFTATGLPGGLSLDPRTGVITGTPAESGEHTIRLTAENASGSGTAALPLTVAAAPPDPWAYRDLGDVVYDERLHGTYGVAFVRTPGVTHHDDGVFTVRGAGADLNVNGQGASAHFAYVPLSGDAEFTARLTRPTGEPGRIGVVMAKSLNPFDLMAGTVVTAGGSGVCQLIRRTKVAGSAPAVNGPSFSGAPVWLRLRRTGMVFTASVSGDGTTWTTVSQDTLAAFGDAPYYAGLAVTSGSPDTLATAVFDQITWRT